MSFCSLCTGALIDSFLTYKRKDYVNDIPVGRSMLFFFGYKENRFNCIGHDQTSQVDAQERGLEA